MQKNNDVKFRVKKKGIWRFIFILLWCAQMLAAVFFCCQKQGFHEDEYYTYYSTARTYGLNVEDNAWMEHDDYFNEFVVLPQQRFQYGLVKQVQSWDVHPPFYYWVFHTIASLFPGRFSKWHGLALNLAAFGVSMLLLKALCMMVTKHNEKLAFLICLFYGFTPAVISSVVFIRMYALLTMFVLLCAALHVKAVESLENSCVVDAKFLIPISIVTYLGFLTQYYYFIFIFFMAVAFCIYLLWKDRNLLNCIRYVFSLATAFIMAYLTYPSCLGQMFRGQRGAQAGRNFFDMSNTLMRLDFFYQLMDVYVFGNMLALLLVVIIMLALFVNLKRRMDAPNHMKPQGDGNRAGCVGATQNCILKSAYFILLFAAAGYFFTVSKTALLLGETSIRYQMPIYGIVVLLLFAAIDWMGKACLNCVHPNIITAALADKKVQNVLIAAFASVALLINIMGMRLGRVVFLYPEDAERISYAKEQSINDIPIIYICDKNQSWCIWDTADEFFEYAKIYFAGQESMEPIDDGIVNGSEKLVLYLSNTAKPQEQLHRIIDNNPNLSGYELKYNEKYCDVYYLYGGEREE